MSDNIWTARLVLVIEEVDAFDKDKVNTRTTYSTIRHMADNPKQNDANVHALLSNKGFKGIRNTKTRFIENGVKVR